MIESLFGGSNDTINILGGIGFFVVVGITAWVLYVYVGAIKNTKSEGELAEENWDGIGEYKNPLPTGWAVIFAGLIVWAAWYYLAGYPLNGYSQIGEWNKENDEYKAKFEAAWTNPSHEELVGMGESIFLAKCAPCHGNTGDGMGGKAQDLTDPMYASYGVEGIVAAVQFGKQGQIGTMPSFAKEGTLTDVQYKAVASYIISIGR
jgi:cytochrome c oxidase cbb3-type subunit 3